MLFTTIHEIRKILPTSKWTDFSRLESLLEEEEQNTLIPITGNALYMQLQDDYDKAVAENGANALPAEGEMPKDSIGPTTLAILRCCQRVVFYKMLANNSGLFSLSFNEGGGLNSSTADNYDEANEKAMQRFVKDAFNKSHRSVDALLKLLEADAQDQQHYTENWKKSRYFYLQANLLFTTASSMQQFLNIDESRERYIQLVPRIRYAQDVYIRPRLGSKLLGDLIAMKYNTMIPNPAATSETEEDGNASEEVQDTEEIHEDAQSTKKLNAILPQVLMALALYVESTEKTMARPLSFSEGEMQIQLARQYIHQHPKDFMEYYCPELADILPKPRPGECSSDYSENGDYSENSDYSNNNNYSEHRGHCEHKRKTAPPPPPHHDPYVLDLGGLFHS